MRIEDNTDEDFKQKIKELKEKLDISESSKEELQTRILSMDQ